MTSMRLSLCPCRTLNRRVPSGVRTRAERTGPAVAPGKMWLEEFLKPTGMGQAGRQGTSGSLSTA
jgi:hypothetical protein